jgi:probable addiction module antidote protein
MATIRTFPWKTEDHLQTADDIVAYLEAVFENGDPALIAHALGALARSRGMTEVSRRAGLGRQSLYKALSPEGRPEFVTVLKVVRALGLKLTVSADRRARGRKTGGTAKRVGSGPRRAKGIKRLVK